MQIYQRTSSFLRVFLRRSNKKKVFRVSRFPANKRREKFRYFYIKNHMEEEELKRAFERCVESSRPLPPLAVKGRDVLDDDDNLAALKEREDAEKAGEYLESLMMKEDDFDGKKKARRCAEMLGPVDAFGREMPFKLEFCMILLLEEEEELGMVEKLTRLARKCEVQLGDSSASASASSASTSIWKQRRNEVLFAIVNARAKRNEYRAALSVCGRICATNGVEGDARTEHAARSTALRILVASGDVGKAHAMLETIDEASIGRDAMLMNRVLLLTASGEYESSLRLLQGGEGVDDAAACAKKICECALLVLKAQPKIALKGMLDALANHPSHYLSTKNEDVGIVALTNICACYDISPSDASAKMAFFRFVKSNCGANENIGNFILKKQQQQQQQTVAANY